MEAGRREGPLRAADGAEGEEDEADCEEGDAAGGSAEERGCDTLLLVDIFLFNLFLKVQIKTIDWEKPFSTPMCVLCKCMFVCFVF